jgi:hypothetical protein
MRMIEFLSLLAHILVSPFKTRARLEAEIILLRHQVNVLRRRLYVSQKGIPHAIELVAAYRADVIDFANSLESALTRQPDLEFRLRKIVGNVGVIVSLLNMVGGFIRSMERLNDGEKYKPPVLTMALGGPFQIMAQAQIKGGANRSG